MDILPIRFSMVGLVIIEIVLHPFENGSHSLNPYSFLVDVIRLHSDDLVLDEHDISYEGDRKRFVALSYEDDTEHYQFMYGFANVCRGMDYL